MYSTRPFRLRFEYKWGSKVANNFDQWQYDAGCYYHLIDDAIWPTGIEYQIRYDHTLTRNHTGDLIRPGGTAYDWYAIHKLNGEVVNMAFNLSPSEGIIGLQGETAEIFYRNIEIKEFDAVIPSEEFLKR